MGVFHPSIIELRLGKSYWRLEKTRRRCGKKLSSRRLVEEVKMMFSEIWRKVFDASLSHFHLSPPCAT